MDKYIEMFAPLLIDWQQTAIANTRYSVVLAALAFIIGCQLVALWKRKSIANLNQQLLEEKQALEQIEHKLKQTEHQHEELLVKHKSDVESITQLQQQLEQVSTNLQESEERYAEILPKHEQLTKVLDEKQSAMDALKSDLDDKTHVVESIQGKLAEQKELLAQYALDKTQIEEMKKEASEASSVKQQLQQRESECREHIKKIEKLEQSVKSSIDRVLELESQLQKRSHTDKSEATLEQVAQLESMEVQLGLEKRNAESKAEYSMELEKTLQQQNQQLAQFNKKLSVLITQAELEPVAEKETSSNDDKGLVSKILKLAAVLDKVDISDGHQHNEEATLNEDVWQKHQRIIDQLTKQLAVQTNDIEPLATDVENDEPVVKSPDVLASDSSKQENGVQLSDVTELIDDFQDKLKGFYNKFRS
jgi:DNA repair exonuclease SbcCD ATPase subunit